MMFRVRTIFFPRNPYLFSDMTWGMIYVLHGLAGVGLIALIMVHIYFGIRPEKRPITKSMIFGWMSREFYLEEHDPKRWVVSPAGCGDHRPEGAKRTKRCQPKSLSTATPSKSATNSCWHTPRKDVRAIRAASRAHRFANFCSAPQQLSRRWPEAVFEGCKRRKSRASRKISRILRGTRPRRARLAGGYRSGARPALHQLPTGRQSERVHPSPRVAHGSVPVELTFSGRNVHPCQSVSIRWDQQELGLEHTAKSSCRAHLMRSRQCELQSGFS